MRIISDFIRRCFYFLAFEVIIQADSPDAVVSSLCYVAFSFGNINRLQFTVANKPINNAFGDF